MIELRDYQRAAIDGLYDWFTKNAGNPLLVCPTGSGKSVLQAVFIKEAVEAWPETRILAVTHVRELIAQNYAALCRIWDWAPAGIYSAGMNRRDIDAQILFCGIQSIHKKAYQVQRCDLLVIDEAHLVPRSGDGMYRRFITELRQINPDMKVVGLTATPYRVDSGRLDRGEDRLFDDIAYDVSVLDMIEQGWLCPPVPKATEMQLDVAGVGTRGGDFVPGQLEAAVDLDEINDAAVREILRHGEARSSWLVFCAGVAHAEHIAYKLRAEGITCQTVTGETPKAERDAMLADFKACRIRALTNANVLTTGFDAPNVDLIAMLRPTKSTGLYVQMVGRGTRLAPNKRDCLILDFAGNTARHGPIDMVDPKTPGQGEGDAPTKVCEVCDTICFAGVRVCPECGTAFPEPEPEISAKASTTAVLSTQVEPEWIEIERVHYDRHEKEDKPPSMLVEYAASYYTSYREWVCFEHTGYARQKACSWWAQRAPGVPAPQTIDEALEAAETLPRPVAIAVRPNAKNRRFTDIVGYRFQ